MSYDSLIPRYDDVIDEGTFARERYLVARCLVDPPQRELLILVMGSMVASTMSHCVIWVESCLLCRLLNGLRVNKSVAQDRLFRLKLI